MRSIGQFAPQSSMSATTTKKVNTKAMRIHGKWYDVEGFNHPGGPVMISLGKGRDATGLFESHHPFTSRARLEKLLAKYETHEPCRLLDESDQGTEFEWPEYENKDGKVADGAPVSAFGKELVDQVKHYFEGEAKRRGVSLLDATKATPMRWLELFVLFSLFLATLPGFFRGEYWTLIAMPLTYWVIGVNIFHDGSHFALSRHWRVNALATYIGWYFSSPIEWYHQHVIGHHVYANIPRKDPDLYHNNAMERHTHTLRWKPMHAHQPSTWLPIWVIGTFAMNYLKPLQMEMSGHYNRAVAKMEMTRSRWLLHWAGRVFVYAMCHLLPFALFPWPKAILFAVVPVTIVSLCFMLSSQINHLTSPNIDQYSSDFYKHQVLTSHTVGKDSYLTFLFTGGLNFQIEHHLFPCVNHCHHRALQPIVQRLCKKHNVPYHYTPTLYQAFRKYIDHLKELAVKPSQ
ncbi:microsomal delta-5 desaturase [Salpingoeca rosetta]|uniref:Microsomal delta-5 desaturase n=1 Tax=Salpingoeca rosetta (strain ATCC 50818 / BSB-021) TaxID=946362 RepID=F2TZR4_SALR5|nr:microsomal delta-5 desaturase [Salpingoeca rosetta]EGD79088.1 microsomal delta-5 desaturase [Salpingoeca rosetta]|eukprot:XP_004998044.1 microsomal delta-5 desaturase [Salpingoeca rosetta]